MEPTVRRPTQEELRRASGRRLRDLLSPGLGIVFCGINPSLYSAAVGHHFARPGNRFWPALHEAGYTPRAFSAFEDERLLALGYGITNLVPRATARADELEPEELVRGARQLRRKLARLRPRFLAVLGIGAYRTGFGRAGVAWGRQEERVGDTAIWVLPNPSGLNASFQLPDLARLFAELRRAAGRE